MLVQGVEKTEEGQKKLEGAEKEGCVLLAYKAKAACSALRRACVQHAMGPVGEEKLLDHKKK